MLQHVVGFFDICDRQNYCLSREDSDAIFKHVHRCLIHHQFLAQRAMVLGQFLWKVTLDLYGVGAWGASGCEDEWLGAYKRL